jgi:NADPH:quinone reductase-like Zn-dependent oxidoreductase
MLDITIINNVVTFNQTDLPEVFDDTVLIKHQLIPLHEIDICHANKNKAFGYIGYGTIVKIGNNIKNFQAGDQVIYVNSPEKTIGEYKVVKQKFLLAPPQNIDIKIVMVCLFRGIIAHMSLVRAFITMPDTNVLIHDVHSLTGTMLALFARKRQAMTIGLSDIIVSSAAHHTFNYNSNIQEIYEVVKSGFHVIFNSILHPNLNDSYEYFRVLGLFIDHMHITNSFDSEMMSKKSLFCTVPNVLDYKDYKPELLFTADETYELIIHEKNLHRVKEYQFNQFEDAFKVIQYGKEQAGVLIVM